MATIVVCIICIAMIVVGGMTLSQGILTSADVTALSVEDLSIRENEINRTVLEAQRAAKLSWAEYLRVTVKNTGQIKLADFDKWDIFVNYYDSAGNYTTRWLPYTDETPGNNQWQNARIGLNGPIDFFEPGILNPFEEMIILARTMPLTGNATTGSIAIATPNGIYETISFSSLGYTLLTPHSENTTIGNTDYYEIAEAAPGDGAAMTCRQDFIQDEGNRKMLFNEDQPSRFVRHVFPLVGINTIPPSTWTVYYRCLVAGSGNFPRADGDVSFNIDILVRQADGTIRTVIATGVAAAYIGASEQGTWITKSGSYIFTGYSVVDENDYLEIDFYGETTLGPEDGNGYIQLVIDDDSLVEADQTRIEG
jgi:hypothetical protein